MEIVYLLLNLALLVTWLWITIAAGRRETVWGLGCFFLPLPICILYPFVKDQGDLYLRAIVFGLAALISIAF